MWIPFINVFVQIIFAINCWRAVGTLTHIKNWLIRMLFISICFAFIDIAIVNLLQLPNVLIIIWEYASTYLLSLFCAMVVIRYQKKHYVDFFGTNN